MMWSTVGLSASGIGTSFLQQSGEKGKPQIPHTSGSPIFLAATQNFTVRNPHTLSILGL